VIPTKCYDVLLGCVSVIIHICTHLCATPGFAHLSGKEMNMANVEELYNEAEQLKSEGNYEACISKLDTLIEQDSNYVLAHLALAVVHGKLGQHEQAVRHGQRACELDSQDPFTFTALSVTFQRAFAGTQNQEFIQLAEDAMAQAHSLQGQR
jgi:tetratricopeptide (TPR) repeat protein